MRLINQGNLPKFREGRRSARYGGAEVTENRPINPDEGAAIPSGGDLPRPEEVPAGTDLPRPDDLPQPGDLPPTDLPATDQPPPGDLPPTDLPATDPPPPDFGPP